MSKIKLLLDVVSDLRSLADSVQDLVSVMTCNEEPALPRIEPLVNVETPKSKVTLEQVRAVMAEKSHGGLAGEVRGLLEKYGAKKLSEIDPEKFADLLQEAEVLGNG